MSNNYVDIKLDGEIVHTYVGKVETFEDVNAENGNVISARKITLIEMAEPKEV